MAIGAKIIGLAKLNRKLKRMPIIAKETIRAAMEAAANEIVQLMKSLVPEVSGDLKDSIGWTWGKRPKYSQVIAVAQSKLADDLTLTIFVGNSKVRYAHLIEFGTAPHINGGLFAGTEHPGTAKQPFFFVSYRAKKKEAQRKIRQAIKKAALQVAQG